MTHNVLMGMLNPAHLLTPNSLRSTARINTLNLIILTLLHALNYHSSITHYHTVVNYYAAILPQYLAVLSSFSTPYFITYISHSHLHIRLPILISAVGNANSFSCFTAKFHYCVAYTFFYITTEHHPN